MIRIGQIPQASGGRKAHQVVNESAGFDGEMRQPAHLDGSARDLLNLELRLRIANPEQLGEETDHSREGEPILALELNEIRGGIFGDRQLQAAPRIAHDVELSVLERVDRVRASIGARQRQGGVLRFLERLLELRGHRATSLSSMRPMTRCDCRPSEIGRLRRRRGQPDDPSSCSWPRAILAPVRSDTAIAGVRVTRRDATLQ